MEIKKVIAGGLATFAAGAAMVLGAGAVTLGDFVQVTGNTMTSPYIVIGDKAAAADTLAGADIAVALAGQATETVSVSGAMATMAVSDGALVKTKSDTLYLNEALNATRTKFTYQELPVVLASGTIEVDNNDVDYTQRLYTKAQYVQFSEADSDWEEPKLNMELTDGTPLYTYEIRFSPSLDTTNVGDVEIELLGENYVFSDVDGANHGKQLTLFASSQTETVSAGESITVQAGDDDYVVTVVGAGTTADEDWALIDVNGKSQKYYEGDDIEEGDLEAYVKSISLVSYPTEYATVELFIGSQSMVLHEGDEIALGGESIDGTSVVFDNTTTDIDEIEITYAMDDDVILEAGDSFTDPVFGGFKVALGGIYPGLTDSSKDVVKVEGSSNDLKFTFTNLDDMEYKQVLLSYDTSALWQTENGANKDVHFLNNATIAEDEFVVVTDNSEYTYILEFTDFSGSSGEEEATLEDVSTGTEYTVRANDYGDTIVIGSLDVLVTGFMVGGADTIALNNTGGAVDEVAKIITKNGASLTFNVNTTCGPQCTTTNDILSTTDAVIVNVEEDGAFDVDTEVSPEVFSLTVSESSNNARVETNETEIENEDGDEAYYLGESGLYILGKDWDEDKYVTLYIPDEATPVYVAFGSDPSFSAGEGAEAGTVEQAIQIKNSISKMESEVNTATLARDLVLLGGPCANGLVATLLEMSSTSPDCVNEFTAEYPTEGVITVVEDAFGSGQKALIVAGVNRAKTRDLAVKVMQGTLDYSA